MERGTLPPTTPAPDRNLILIDAATGGRTLADLAIVASEYAREGHHVFFGTNPATGNMCLWEERAHEST